MTVLAHVPCAVLRQGSGKVEYQTPEAAQLAVQKLDGSELDGRQLHVTC